MLQSCARVLRLLVVGSCATFAAGCRQSAYDIARRDDEELRNKVDTLLLLVSVAPAARPEPALGPSFVEQSRIVEVALTLDGNPLGKFRTVQRGPAHGGSALDRLVTAERDAALVRADFGELYDPATLKTVGDWAKALGGTIGTGTHVLEVAGITLKSESGAEVVYPARAFLPFTIEDGASTAFAGRADLVLPGAVQ